MSEAQSAILSQKIGKAAATEPDRAKKQQLVTTQARNPKHVDAEASFTRYQRGRALKGYKRGGKVGKTGLAMVHRGERVLTRKQNTKFKSSSRTAKSR